MDRIRLIRVPKNTAAAEQYNYGIIDEREMVTLSINNAQFDHLLKLGVIDELNDACDALIDDYEEEVIGLEQIPTALSVIASLIQDNPDKLLYQLQRLFMIAQKSGTLVGFDF